MTIVIIGITYVGGIDTDVINHGPTFSASAAGKAPAQNISATPGDGNGGAAWLRGITIDISAILTINMGVERLYYLVSGAEELELDIPVAPVDPTELMGKIDTSRALEG